MGQMYCVAVAGAECFGGFVCVALIPTSPSITIPCGALGLDKYFSGSALNFASHPEQQK